MKKAAEKSAVRWSCVVLAALFFFLAALSGSLWNLQKTYGMSADENAGREILVYKLYKDRVRTLSEEILPTYFESYGTMEPPYAADLDTKNTNYRFSVNHVVEKDGEKKTETILETIRDDENLQYKKLEEEVPVEVQYASGAQTEKVTVFCALVKPMEKQDVFKRVLDFAVVGASFENTLWIAAVVLGLLTLLCCLLAVWGAVREASRVRGAQRLFNVLPPDLYVCCVLPALVILYKLVLDVYQSSEILKNYLRNGSGEYRFLLRPICMSIIFLLILILLILVVYSIQRGGIQCLFAIRRFQQIPFTRRTVFYLFVMQVIKAASIGLYLSVALFNPELNRFKYGVILFLLLEKVVTLPVIFRTLRQLRALMDRTAQFVGGDLTGNASVESDYATLRLHGADVDALAQRISESANEYIQSSNFKAELITNLSHDIKTPLTSIISYAHLLQREDLTQAERTQYIDVLQRHSGRLQKLVDDLSDVSDAASGNVPVQMMVLDLCSMIRHAVAGFEERLLKQNITIRFILPEKPVFVAADPRLLQRVVDNLMNNICKYTRDDSEVQIAVVEGKSSVAVIFRNRSFRPFTLSGEELMERFVREDAARHTDGSGLGLSIAQSLMKLQGGKLWLHTEDDIFTTQILFRKS